MDTLQFGLGTFEGFNFRDQCAICKRLTAEDVMNWDHDADGEAEFWPSGDNPGVRLVFRREVTGSDLLELDRVLAELGDDSMEKYVRIHHALDVSGGTVRDLTGEKVEDSFLHVFLGTSFSDLRKEAAYELFELYYPEAYKAWHESTCDGLIFDVDHFLDSTSLSVEELTLGDTKALVVAPQ